MMKEVPRFDRPSTPSTKAIITKVNEKVTKNLLPGLREETAKLSVSHESIRLILNKHLGKNITHTYNMLAPKGLFSI